MAEMKLKTGAVKYVIKDEFDDEIGVIKFNPGDLDIARRFKEVAESFKELKVSDTPTEDEIFELTDTIKAKFDYLLNANTSGTIFAVTSPLTPTASGFYFSNVMDVIEKIIAKELNTRMKKMDAALKDIDE